MTNQYIRHVLPGSNRGVETSPHSFRCSDSVWETAKLRAEAEDVPMNYVIDQFITGYAHRKMHLPKDASTFEIGANRGVPTSPHSFRCSDEVWENAKARSEEESVNMNFVIEQFITAYAEDQINLPTIQIQYDN